MPCLMMLYCSICESNEIFGRKAHKLLKWILENKASESNNYTFEIHQILLTVFTYRKSEICMYIFKLLMFPFYSHDGKWGKIVFYLPTDMGKNYPAELCTHTDFSRLPFPLKQSFYWSTISDFSIFLTEVLRYISTTLPLRTMTLLKPRGNKLFLCAACLWVLNWISLWAKPSCHWIISYWKPHKNYIRLDSITDLKESFFMKQCKCQ